ncbi:MAG TPA: AAA domain-containing protein [Actinophytocola sp.]|uniref:AAA domain-containing protein n=1 Tax=Actinophytocola sp. TaxID=1872138 RepID=UPI002DDC9BF7|nr:AAA domain-containing protein [Actinophytocola sp.]HEV2782295.1 AAA domain-containing protein [Actinophytocola sp.]
MVSRALRLFEFLGRVQQLRSNPPRTVDAYQRVLWLADVPEHPAVTVAHRGGAPEPDAALLAVDRVPRLDPPLPDEPLRPWLDGRVDDPHRPPVLRQSITIVSETDWTSRKLLFNDRQELREGYQRWWAEWQAWAEIERRDRPVRELYGELFSTYVTATGHPEELELVAGVGCLAWSPAGHPPVRRHLLTAPVAIHFDDDTGRLTVVRVESVEPVGVELDMLDPGLTNSPHLNEVRAQARLLDAHPLDRDEIGSLVRRLVHSIDAGSEYRDTDEPPVVSPGAVATFAPAILLRRRSQQGLVDIFRTICAQLAETGEVPDGVLPLIDPDYQPPVSEPPSDGAIVVVDDDPFLPLPVNDVQLRIINRVDTRAQTLVQGPPGTGKTHTAAALLSHLLAQGKRVLVTAHTDRALKEVRAKLPAAIKPLSVAIVGSSREDMSDLKVAVERIAVAAAEHDPEAAAETVRACQEAIENLRVRRAALRRALIEAREQEVREHEHAGYRGTLAAIARQHLARAESFAWLGDYVQVPADSSPPVEPEELVEWRGYLLDERLIADEPEARQRLLDLSAVPEPAALADLVAAERAAATADDQFAELKSHPAFGALSKLDVAVRGDLQRRLHQLAGEADDLARRREQWMTEALSDVRNGRVRIWQARGQQISQLLHQSDPLVRRLGPTTEVTAESTVATLVPPALALYQYLNEGGKLRTAADGSAKIGSFAARQVKQAQPLFDQVRVNGLPPTTLDRLGAFLTWAEATKILAALDRAWPDGVRPPVDETLHERQQWHITELEQLHRVLRLGEWLEIEERRLAELGLPRPDWTDRRAVHTYASLVDAAAAQDARAAASQPLHQIEQTPTDAARWADAAPCVRELLDAVRRRDHDSYAAAHARLARLAEVVRTAERRDDIAARLSATVPLLHQAVLAAPSDVDWNERLGSFGEAWAWASTGTWIAEQGTVDVNALQAEIADIEERIRRQVETLAATRAWGHAVSAERLTGQARANLEHYAYLVRKLGKGTGKYAEARRAEIRQAMDRCRPAVPVWIMPIYRIAEQLQVRPDMFDVVVVDEASQAGLEATFLQYLAPKMVVIGDDKQVSPSAVGVDQQQLRDLAGQYLADDPYRASWQDPQRSLFDEAKMRFSGLLTLTEHRRCVPEIIGFSNRIAYEPDGIRLIPVRQYGADRLEPIKAVFLPDGHVLGGANKINPVEAAAIVDQIEKCIADPRYDGLTMGVISLLGTAQAKAIETELLTRITPEELVARDLRCGDSAAFQGSERDVMFLSMVAAPSPDARLGVLSRDLFVQRYNVAASRARDQMWLFHSVPLAELGHPEDMRFALLDYCYEIINQGTGDEDVLTDPVPDDRLVVPFESLFAQRVFNRLVERGFAVIPRHDNEIDLVVVGAKSRLAIACDGDTWHGPEAYQRHLARQRDLERCGWRFFRIRESAFYVDEAAVLEDLWATLRELDIRPLGQEPVPEPPPMSTVDSRPVAPHQDLAPYEEFTGALPPTLDATRAQLVDGLRAIVAVEGPIVGHRLHAVYVKCSGGRRVGKLMANALNTAIAAAVRDGILVEENPLQSQGLRSRTYRLPDQPSVRVRTLGPRAFEHLPPAELAAMLSLAATVTGWSDEEALYRTTLDLLGLKRLTPNISDHLRAVRTLTPG